ncbi:S53 family peptidase [Paenibacillus sediminis]|uniref:Kumamolisin n=1 Tax=Paenibacillus sediminis TaxID=664909 RepID=A0ABS4H527_9BACL|nr:S53 family peptidase [Paenibacillus sediminis]MBP1937586.1 kumamolisin [Paenibacillus sediminis]
MDKSNLEHANYVRIPGSERTALPSARKIGSAEPNEQMSVTVLVRRPSITNIKPSQSRFLSREQFAADHSIDPEDLKKVEQFSHEHGLEIKEINVAAGTIVLTGSILDFSKAFDVELTNYEHTDFTYRGREGHVHIPEDLADIIEAVVGLDNRPQAIPHFRILEETEPFARSNAAKPSFTPPEVAQLYNFPSDINCNDQCIGIIELGGGYRSDDLETYFNSLGIPSPTITDVSIGGKKNQPTGDPNGPDGEVVLDIEIAAAVAPGARIAVYFAPNTDAGFLRAITTAIHDNVSKPSVISISWGNAESRWTLQAMKAMNRAFQDAAALGITICCASGDTGSSDGINDGLVHVDFPASSPYVLGCGGTRLEGSNHTITNEVVWNEGIDSGTGGGVSHVFDLPSWQEKAHVPPSANPGSRAGRGVPDVAGNADPATGYEVLVDGRRFIIGGTSAVAPLWAGLIAIINQKLGRSVGFVNPVLYSLSPEGKAFHDITIGNNDTDHGTGPYPSQAGWDACTGLGSPDGTQLMKELITRYS